MRIEDIFILDYYKLPNEQTMCTFGNGQLIYRFCEEETLVFSDITNNIVTISENCKLALFIKDLCEKFLCESLVMEGRLLLKCANFIFDKNVTIAKNITLYLHGVLIINTVSHLIVHIIEYK